jgi:hypothetical protein
MIILKLIFRGMGFNFNNKNKKNKKIKNNNENWRGETFKRHETFINPGTGLPMIGSVDVAGNAFGSSYSDVHRSSYDDYHRHQPIENIFDYDAFNRPW